MNEPERDESLNQYFTPPAVTRCGLACIKRAGGLQLGRVLEPCAGNGQLADVLRDSRRTQFVFTNDYDQRLVNYHDHDLNYDFVAQGNLDWFEPDWVITNPPFTTDDYKASDFVKKALTVASTGVAFLLRDSFLEACRDRRDLLKTRPPSHIYHLYPRISFTPDGGHDSAHYLWCIWHRPKRVFAHGSESWDNDGECNVNVQDVDWINWRPFKQDAT